MQMVLGYIVTAKDSYVQTVGVYGSQETKDTREYDEEASKGKELAILGR